MNNDHANAHLPNGRVIGEGKYKITRLISSGPFGCTYEAEYILMESKVAIKEFFLAAYCNRLAQGTVEVGTASQAPVVSKYEERFLAEAREVYKLQGAGIVRVIDIIRENGTSYVVTEYVEGQSLQQIIDTEGPLPEDRALRYASQAALALHQAHANGMLHLNVQPSNILIDQDDNVVLIGFGAWKQTDKEDLESGRTAILPFAQEYAPMEQNSAAPLTPAADIYSLGATLYAALTGSTPAPAASLATGEAKLKPLPANVSYATKQAVAAMLQPNVQKRPQSAEQLSAKLKPKSDEGPATKPYGGSGPELQPFNPVRPKSSRTPTAPLMGTAPLTDGSGTLPLSEIAGEAPGSGTLPLSEIAGEAPGSGTLPLSEIAGEAPGGGTLPLSEIADDKKGDSGTMPLSSISDGKKGGKKGGKGTQILPGGAGPKPAGGNGSGGKKKKSGALMWVLIAVGALVIIGGGLGGWMIYKGMQADKAIQEQKDAEKAVYDHYNELMDQAEKLISYNYAADNRVWKPLVEARLLLDSLKYYGKEYSDFKYYPLDDSGLSKMEEEFNAKNSTAKEKMMIAADGQYQGGFYSDAIQYWHIAALLDPNAEIKDIVAKLAREKVCQAAYMAVYKASASGGKLTITYYGLRDRAVDDVKIEYALDGKAGSQKVSIEPGFNTVTFDINSTASSGELSLSCNGITFYNQKLDN